MCGCKDKAKNQQAAALGRPSGEPLDDALKRLVRVKYIRPKESQVKGRVSGKIYANGKVHQFGDEIVIEHRDYLAKRSLFEFIEFEDVLRENELLGITPEDLKELGDAAEAMADEFGTTADEVAMAREDAALLLLVSDGLELTEPNLFDAYETLRLGYSTIGEYRDARDAEGEQPDSVVKETVAAHLLHKSGHEATAESLADAQSVLDGKPIDDKLMELDVLSAVIDSTQGPSNRSKKSKSRVEEES